jgi:homoserine O-succinyltransferase
MPVFVKSRRGNDPPQARAVTIGLINNMPESAFRATERQFVSLLTAACEDISIELSFYSLPGVLKRKLDEFEGASNYSSVESLWGSRLDGLIVTGTEPVMADLRDEAYWESFSKVLEWARGNTYSTVWSCLAAHAAVLHMDGIGRRRSEDKYSGVFDCERMSDHPLMAGVPHQYRVPHSRWNGVEEKELETRGYGLLTRTAEAGVDAFFKEEGSLFVFFQGHPEYESDTLLREYRRDVGRYLRLEVDKHPSIPRGYFDRETELALIRFREKAMLRSSEESLSGVVAALEAAAIENTWNAIAVLIYRNWLEYIRARASEEQPNGQVNDVCPVPR